MTRNNQTEAILYCASPPSEDQEKRLIEFLKNKGKQL